MTEAEMKVLKELARYYDSDTNCLYFSHIANATDLDRAEVRAAVRLLANKGMALYVRGLFDDEGNVAGSGYCCTPAGLATVESIAALAEETSK